MRRSELTTSVILIPLDYLALLGAAALAYSIRFTGIVEELRPITFRLQFPSYFRTAAVVALAWILLFALAGAYATAARRRWTTEVSRIVLASTAGFGLVLALIVFSRELFASRFIVLASWPLAIGIVLIVRTIVRLIERAAFARGMGARRIALLGTGRSADALAEAFHERPSLGFRIVTRIPQFDHAAADTLAAAWAGADIDEVIDASTPPDLDRLHRLLEFCRDRHLPIRYSADVLAAHAPRVNIEAFAGVPLVEVSRTRLAGWGRVWKRAFDVTIAVFLCILLAPLMGAIALAIRLDSRGPILFRQQRIGQAGRPFTFLKFRSMVDGASAQWEELREQSDRSGPVPKIKNDPRVTLVGRWIRRWSLDELPQLGNVLAGTMSLVGPRPHLPEEVANYAVHHRAVLAVRPGITGLAQVSGRADLDFEEEVQLDTYYVERWSPALDVIIMLRTPLAVVRARGAY